VQATVSPLEQKPKLSKAMAEEKPKQGKATAEEKPKQAKAPSPHVDKADEVNALIAKASTSCHHDKCIWEFPMHA